VLEEGPFPVGSTGALAALFGPRICESSVVAVDAEMALIASARFVIACITLLWFNKDNLVFCKDCRSLSILYFRLLMS
jgi:hypothetical protein